jgi:hypothetical protein
MSTVTYSNNVKESIIHWIVPLMFRIPLRMAVLNIVHELMHAFGNFFIQILMIIFEKSATV